MGMYNLTLRCVQIFGTTAQHTIALGLTQLLTEMSTTNVSWG
jgi:hypothetical protein